MNSGSDQPLEALSTSASLGVQDISNKDQTVAQTVQQQVVVPVTGVNAFQPVQLPGINLELAPPPELPPVYPAQEKKKGGRPRVEIPQTCRKCGVYYDCAKEWRTHSRSGKCASTARARKGPEVQEDEEMGEEL